jgi:regulator of PEP synthase PpsR (kinase-PPPase family)
MSSHPIFYISDQTGITVETLGNSLLRLYPSVKTNIITLPFIDSISKANKVVEDINDLQKKSGTRPVIFVSIINPKIREIIGSQNFLVLDLFELFLAPLTAEFNEKPSNENIKSHTDADSKEYEARMDATNFALSSDDGVAMADYDKSDIILVGVSRSGKTPTCLFLALRYGIFASNYPLTEEDLEESKLPKALAPYRSKLYGLSISPERLRSIRIARRGEGKYSSQQQVNFESRAALTLFQKNHIPFSDTTHQSIEEVASRIFSETKLVRRISP